MLKHNRGRDKFKKYKLFINILTNFFYIFPSKIRVFLFEHYRNTTGIKGIVLRYVLLKTIALKCGDNVTIHPGVYLFKPNKLIINNNVSIHPMCYIDATGGIEIGNDVSIAHGVTIMSTTHKYQNLTIPIKDQEIDSYFTMISDNVWIGAKATILAGNKILKGSIIAAGAVVTRDVAENKIVAGVPAKIIRDRV